MGKAADRGEAADQKLEPFIFVVRGQRVMLDADLARLYGVTTKRFNEGFKRNRERFPEDFAFQLTVSEFVALRSALTAQAIEVTEDSSNCSQNATSSSAFMAGPMRHRSVSYRPWAEIDKTLLQHDAALREVYRKLQTLLAPPRETPKRRIGF